MRNASFTDILLWLALAAMWSSSYVVIKIGLETIDPPTLVLGRMAIGCIAIYVALRLAGLSLSRAPRHWLSYGVTGLLGSAIPFLLITWGEQTVDSALASILMGTTPVVTLLLASCLIPDETLTPRSVTGVFGGFAGILLLVGPSALSGLGNQVTGQAAIIGATVCYAASTVYIRRFVERPALEMAAGSMIVGTAFVACFTTVGNFDAVRLITTPASLWVVLYLGLVSTASANLIYFYLVPRLGATRMTQVNFAVPVGGALLGATILGEALTTERLIAVAIILFSVWLGTSAKTSRRTNRKGSIPSARGSGIERSR